MGLAESGWSANGPRFVGPLRAPNRTFKGQAWRPKSGRLDITEGIIHSCKDVGVSCPQFASGRNTRLRTFACNAGRFQPIPDSQKRYQFGNSPTLATMRRASIRANTSTSAHANATWLRGFPPISKASTQAVRASRRHSDKRLPDLEDRLSNRQMLWALPAEGHPGRHSREKPIPASPARAANEQSDPAGYWRPQLGGRRTSTAKACTFARADRYAD